MATTTGKENVAAPQPVRPQHPAVAALSSRPNSSSSDDATNTDSASPTSPLTPRSNGDDGKLKVPGHVPGFTPSGTPEPKLHVSAVIRSSPAVTTLNCHGHARLTGVEEYVRIQGHCL